MTEIRLSAKDKKIINELDLNARQSYSQIARKVGLTKDTVQYRIKRLEEMKVIEGYFPVINTAKLGYVFYRVCLKFRSMTPKKEEEFVKHLKSNKAIGWISSFNGRWDMIIAIWAKNIIEFEEILSGLLLGYEKYIQEKIVSTIVYFYHFKNKIITEVKPSARNPFALADG